MTIYTHDDASLQAVANNIKELLLWHLEQEGLLTNSRQISERYAVVVHRRGMLGWFIDKLRGLPKDAARFVVVKVLPDKEPEDASTAKEKQISVCG